MLISQGICLLFSALLVFPNIYSLGIRNDSLASILPANCEKRQNGRSFMERPFCPVITFLSCRMGMSFMRHDICLAI